MTELSDKMASIAKNGYRTFTARHILKAEKDGLAEIERKRIEDKEHRDKVEQKVHEILFGIITYHVDDNEMKAHKIAAHIVTAIKENSIAHVTINY